MVGNAPFEQLKACSILLDLPHIQLAGVNNHIEVQLHHKSHPYEEQNHGIPMAKWTAKRKHLSHQQVLGTAEDQWIRSKEKTKNC